MSFWLVVGLLFMFGGLLATVLLPLSVETRADGWAKLLPNVKKKYLRRLELWSWLFSAATSLGVGMAMVIADLAFGL